MTIADLTGLLPIATAAVLHRSDYEFDVQRCRRSHRRRLAAHAAHAAQPRTTK